MSGDLLGAVRIAGWHGDVIKLRNLLLAPGARPLPLETAYVEGKRLRARGVPCGCADCLEVAGRKLEIVVPRVDAVKP